MKYYIGIDSGKDGGVVVIDLNGVVVDELVMPIITSESYYNLKNNKKYEYVNTPLLKEFLGYYSKDSFIVLEKVWGRGSNKFNSGFSDSWSAETNFKFGGFFVPLLEVIESLDTGYTTITAKKWQNKVLPKEDGDTKKLARKVVIADRCRNVLTPVGKRVPHEGLVDAYLIAKYGLISKLK